MTPEEAEGRPTPAPRSRRSRRRAVHIAIVGVIVVAAVIIGFLGSAPEPDRTTTYVLDRAEALLGREVRVRALVVGWDSDNMTFYMSDGESTLQALYSKAPPHQLTTDKEAIVIGVLRESGGTYYIEVDEIIVGHPG